MAFYERRTSGLPPSILEFAMPAIQLGMTMKDRKKAEQDYALKRQWEEEDRALKQKQLEESKALSAEERAYQRSRDTKEDMFRQEGLDRADLKDLEANRRFDAEQKRLASNDEFNKAHQNAMLKLSQQAAEYGKTNPYLGSLFKQLESYTDAYGKAIIEGNSEGAAALAPQIISLNDKVKQIMSGGTDPNMGLIQQPPQRGVIPQADRATEIQNTKAIPKPTDSPAVNTLRQLVQSENKTQQGKASEPNNNVISESEIDFAMRQFKTDRPTAILMIQKRKEVLNAAKDYGLRGIKKVGNVINQAGNVVGSGMEYLGNLNSEIY